MPQARCAHRIRRQEFSPGARHSSGRCAWEHAAYSCSVASYVPPRNVSTVDPAKVMEAKDLLAEDHESSLLRKLKARTRERAACALIDNQSARRIPCS